MRLFKKLKRNTKRDELLLDKIQEALEELSKMGIGPNDDDFIEWLLSEWGKDRVEDNLFPLVLFTLGSEREINYKWMPLSDDVYTFDTECIIDGAEYIEVLQRLSTISKGEFILQNIECTVNHEECVASLSFKYSESMYHWNLEYQDDWFDCNVITRINEILKKHGSTKFYYSSSDDQNMNIIFSSVYVINELNKMIPISFEMI